MHYMRRNQEADIPIHNELCTHKHSYNYVNNAICAQRILECNPCMDVATNSRANNMNKRMVSGIHARPQNDVREGRGGGGGKGYVAL